MKINTTTLMISLAIGVLVLLIGGAALKNRLPSKLDSFAQCLTDNGAKIYAASWCPHCAQQYELFGSAARKLNKKECAVPGSRNLDLCKDDGIQTTPTWETATGERISGTQSLEKLAEIYNCTLPE